MKALPLSARAPVGLKRFSVPGLERPGSISDWNVCRRRSSAVGAGGRPCWVQPSEELSPCPTHPPTRTQQRLRKCGRPPRRPSSQARMPGQTQPGPCCSHKGPLCPPAALPTPQGPQTPPCGLCLPKPDVELEQPLPRVFPCTPGPLVPEVGDPNLWWVPRRF